MSLQLDALLAAILFSFSTALQLNSLAVQPLGSHSASGPLTRQRPYEPFYFSDQVNEDRANFRENLDAPASDDQSPADIPTSYGQSQDGVVCPTFLNKDILKSGLIPHVNRTEGYGNSTRTFAFVDEVKRLCGGSAGPASKGYTGKWSKHKPTQNDIRVLRGLFDWNKEHRKSTSAFTIDHDPRGPWLRELAGEDFVPEVNRILDFGCGGGADLAVMKTAFEVPDPKNLLCLDIFATVAKGVTPIIVDATSDASYQRSLSKAIVPIEGTVDLAFSFVTFHHVNQGPNMRSNAFRFITRSLRPKGIFIMSEWDNGGLIDRTIWYDIDHIMPPLLHSEFCPTRPSQLPQNCRYFSYDEWDSQINEASNGLLRYDNARTAPTNMHPRSQANYPGNYDRNFIAVWMKGRVPM